MIETANQEPRVNMDSPIGKQLMAIQEHITALEHISEDLKTRTFSYCLRLQDVPRVNAEVSPGELSQLESMLKMMAHRLDKVGYEIETTVRGLQI